MRLLTAALLASTLSAATVDGIAIHRTITGTGPQTVILVHRWACDETVWSEQVAALAGKYRVVTLDLPGHGKSGSPQDGKFTMELFARAIEAVRAEVEADRIVLVGHSMGTPVIVQYARAYPARVTGLVFVDGRVTFGPKGPSKFNRQQWLGEDGRKNRERMIAGMYTPNTKPALQTRIRDMVMATTDVGAAGAMEAYHDPSIWKNEILSVPVLAIYAERSAAGQREYMPDHFRHMEYHEVDAGHFLMLEKPEEFNRLLLAFLAQLK